MYRLIAPLTAALFAAAPAMAEGFTRITDKNQFVSIVEDRNLTRFSIKLQVNPEGDITGRAFGRDVSGDWQWQDGYFCRSLFWGEREIGDNCQQVEYSGSTLRFTSDRGTGDSADLTLTK